jgi:hypothetical protein
MVTVYKCALIIGAIVYCALSFRISQTVDAAQNRLPPGVLSIHLESNEPVYQVKEPVQVRISIHNNSSQDYAIAYLPPWALFSLTIVNEKNKPLQSGGIKVGYSIRMTAIRYPAGSTQFIGFGFPKTTPALVNYWVPVSYWGYDLGVPGTYTIIAVPKFTAFTTAGAGTYHAVTASAEERSNPVRIEIVR